MNAYDDLGWLYDEWVTSVTEDIPFYVGLADRVVLEERITPGNSPDAQPLIVELGAGSGRISLPVATTGAQVLAVDTSAVLLDRLAMRAEVADVTIECLNADAVAALEDMPTGSVAAVFAPFRMLLHLTDRRDELISQIARVLRRDGLFAFDLFHPSLENLGDDHDVWNDRVSFEDIEQPELEWTIFERAHYEAAEDLLTLELRCQLHEEDQLTPLKTLETSMHLHGSSVHEWRVSLNAAGLTIHAIDSWFDGMPYELGDSDSIWQARK